MSDKVIRFYTDEVLGKKQSLTPEGFLLCEEVPICRTGPMLYAEGEIPVEGDRDHLVRILRDDDEVFAPSSVLSFAGKPVTNEHPPEKVAPGNWKDYSVGVTLNPRRGDGRTTDARYLYADLLIQEAQAIQDVRLRRRRQVSAGYDAEYEQIRPGEGRQHNIIGNHVALVEKGRCGPTCSIGDSAMPTAATASRGNRRPPAWKDRIVKAYRTRDENTLVDELDKVGEMMGEVHTGDDYMQPDAGGADPHHHITVNIGHPGGEARATDVADPPDGGAPPAGAVAPDPSSGGSAAGGAPGGAEQTLQQVLARLDALEEAVSVLANGDGGAGSDDNTDPSPDEPPPEDNEKTASGDRRTVDTRGRTRDDDDATGTAANEMRSPSMPGKPEAGSRGTADRRASVGDSTSLRSSWQDFLARTEILAPGFKVATFDAAKPAKDTHVKLCDLRREVLGRALNNQDTADAVTTMAGTDRPNFSRMTCDAVTVLFTGASEMVKRSNNARMTADRGSADAYTRGNQELVRTVADINERNRKFYRR